METPAGLENQALAHGPVPPVIGEQNTVKEGCPPADLTTNNAEMMMESPALEGELAQKHHPSTDLANENTQPVMESQALESIVVEDDEAPEQAPAVPSVEDDEGFDDSDSNSDWTDESLIGAHVDVIDDEQYGAATAEYCSLEESKQLRAMLKDLGPEDFIIKTLETGDYTARKLCTAFGAVYDDVEFLSLAHDHVFLPLLGALMKKEMTKRYRLEQYTTIDHAVGLLQQCKKIVVITGAGISTNLGIPDFRSKGTGLYSRLEHLGLSDPQEVFDIGLFHEDPTIFYSVAKDIVPATNRFSPTHAFIRLLQDKDKLLTNFTQNIDNLEEAAGIDREKLIQCHGSFATATCQKCRYNCPGNQIADDLKAGRVAQCPACQRAIRQLQPLGLKRKKSYTSTSSKKKQRRDFEGSSDDDDDDDDFNVPGVMKPDITFFGEDLPKVFYDRVMEHDHGLVDLVIVIGTSLKVAPVADIPSFFPRLVPQIYISRDPVKHIQFDVELLGDCDQIVTELCRRAGWDFQHEMVPVGQVLEAHSYEDSTTRWRMLPAEGSATVRREALDSGTLGHGTALSPTPKRHDHGTATAFSDDTKTLHGQDPAPKSEALATEALPATLDGTADLPSQAVSLDRIPSQPPALGPVPNGAALEEDDDVGDSITLTPRSAGTPAPYTGD